MSILDILDSVQTEYRRISNAAEMSVSGGHQMITARASPISTNDHTTIQMRGSSLVAMIHYSRVNNF